MHPTRDQDSDQRTHALNHLNPKDGTEYGPPHHPQRPRNTMWVQSWSLNSEEMWAGDWDLLFRDPQQPATPSPSLRSPPYHLCDFCPPPPSPLLCLLAAAPTPAPKLLVLPFCLGCLGSMHPKSFLFTSEPRMDDDVPVMDNLSPSHREIHKS